MDEPSLTDRQHGADGERPAGDRDGGVDPAVGDRSAGGGLTVRAGR